MIINNFSFVHESGDVLVTQSNLEEFSKVWVEKYDKEASGCISISQVWGLMTHIGEPLGFYGSDGNHGRYLCIRNNLERVMLHREELENGATFFHRVHDTLHELEFDMDTQIMMDFKIKHKEADEWGKIRVQRMKLWKKKKKAGSDTESSEEEEEEEEEEEVRLGPCLAHPKCAAVPRRARI